MSKEKFYVSNGTQCWKFNSLKGIFKYNSPAQPITVQSIGHNFNDTYIDGEIFSEQRRIKVSYVVYDCFWRVVRKEVIEEALTVPSRNFSNWRYHKSDHENYLGFRNGPVPSTGKNAWGFYNWYRAIKTTHELKWNCAHKKFTRAKRRNIRNAWDDIPRADKRIKQSWKKQKKRKQWM